MDGRLFLEGEMASVVSERESRFHRNMWVKVIENYVMMGNSEDLIEGLIALFPPPSPFLSHSLFRICSLSPSLFLRRGFSSVAQRDEVSLKERDTTVLDQMEGKRRGRKEEEEG